MSNSAKVPSSLDGINVVMLDPPSPQPSEGQNQSDNAKKDPAVEFNLNKAAVSRFAADSNWPEAIKVLKMLSTKHRNKDVYKAIAMRAWICLKSDAGVDEVVLSLFNLLNTLGAKHEVAGPIAALAHLMAKNRTPEHEDRYLAMGQAQQMFNMICDYNKIVGEDAFNKWVETNNLDDPNHYIPIVMNCLDIMVGDDWWFDREQLQNEMEEANAKKIAEKS
ncbi:MAG: hypothetical protein HQL71_06455 [Magnetococcales bacterium]|nr:hypothetical protein [Magnetococcales bacterium]